MLVFVAACFESCRLCDYVALSACFLSIPHTQSGEGPETSRMISPLASAPKPRPPTKPPPKKHTRAGQSSAPVAAAADESYDPATPYSIVVVGGVSTQAQQPAPVKAPRPSKQAASHSKA